MRGEVLGLAFDLEQTIDDLLTLLSLPLIAPNRDAIRVKVNETYLVGKKEQQEAMMYLEESSYNEGYIDGGRRVANVGRRNPKRINRSKRKRGR